MEVGRDERWVWIDDAHGHDDHVHLTQQGFDPANFRLLQTDVRTGLTWADVERALAGCRSRSRGRGVRRSGSLASRAGPDGGKG